MRITLEIDDEVLQAAKALARRESRTAGQVLSALARRGLAVSAAEQRSHSRTRNGVPLVPSRGEDVTLDQLRRLMGKEGV